MQEFWARLYLAGLGLVCGAVPFIYALVRQQIVWGAVVLAVSGLISAVGLPYLAPVTAGLGFWLIYTLAKKARDKNIHKNNQLYRQKLREQEEAGREAMIGTIENHRTANASWPPVNQVVDPEALQEFEQLMQEKTEGRK